MKKEEKKIIKNICQTCRAEIYEDEIIYSSEAKIPNPGKRGELETWTQCGWCYDQWQAESEERQTKVAKWWKWGWIIGAVAAVIFGIIGLATGGDEWIPFGGGAFAITLLILTPLITWITRLIWRSKSVVDRYQTRDRNAVSETPATTTESAANLENLEKKNPAE